MARLGPEERASFCGLQCVLSEAQRMRYLSLPTRKERSEWLARFWITHDPTPATEENEARVEHERRVDLARKLFAMTEAPGWDARGEILIRFGLPTARAKTEGDVSTGGLSLPGELWYYEAFNMSVLFNDVNLNGRYAYNVAQRQIKVPGPPVVSVGGSTGFCRGPFEPLEMDYNADELDRLLTLQFWNELEWTKAERAADNFYKYDEEYSAIYECEMERKPLPLYFDVSSFKGGEHSLRTEVSLEIPANGVKLVPGRDGHTGEVELKVLVRDEMLRPVARGSDRIELAAGADTMVDRVLLPGQIVLALEPGRYHVGIEARDTHSKRRAAYRTDVELVPYRTSPAVSDIEFASSIKETEENNSFMKGNLRVVPHPSRTYRIPSPVVFYFEIYGLDTDEKGLTFYRIEYRIDPLEKKRWGPVLQDAPTNISSTFETSGYGSTQAQRLSIATENLWKGNFNLIVTVTDRRTFHAATRSGKFTVLE